MDKLHTNHRHRMKSRFREKGLDGFSDHEILEFLLYFGIPYKNTNEIAHLLLNRFRSLSGVLDADYEELITQKGIGENTATLINFIPSLFRAYSLDKYKSCVVFDTMDKIGEFLINHYIGATREHVEVLLFDGKMKMIDHVTVHEGAVNSSDINPEKLAEIVFSRKSSCFVLSHNHPGGCTEPSVDDLRITKILREAFEPFNKFMIEHVIVSGGEYRCILNDSLLNSPLG